jgi:DNA transformation protein
MAKMSAFLEYVVYDLFGDGEPVTWRAMMGGYILYYEGKPFAIVDGETLWFKGNKDTKEWYIEKGSKQFEYNKKDKKTGESKSFKMNYFSVPEEVQENREMFKEWTGTACG